MEEADVDSADDDEVSEEEVEEADDSAESGFMMIVRPRFGRAG